MQYYFQFIIDKCILMCITLLMMFKSGSICASLADKTGKTAINSSCDTRKNVVK